MGDTPEVPWPASWLSLCSSSRQETYGCALIGICGLSCTCSHTGTHRSSGKRGAGAVEWAMAGALNLEPCGHVDRACVSVLRPGRRLGSEGSGCHFWTSSHGFFCWLLTLWQSLCLFFTGQPVIHCAILNFLLLSFLGARSLCNPGGPPGLGTATWLSLPSAMPHTFVFIL